MPLDLYFDAVSPPCRAVMLTCRALDLDVNMKHLDLRKGETKTPEFIAINPQHTLPTLVDGDLKIWESRAICTYLVSQYGKNDSLYPKDPTARVKVDRLLYFEMGTLYKRYAEVVYPVMRGETKEIVPAKLDALYEAMGWLEGYLAGHKWAAGDNITVADFVLVSSVQAFEVNKINLSKFKNIAQWLSNCKLQLKGYDDVCNQVMAMIKKLLEESYSNITLWKD
ncbi:unnamed protein product, partial [Meganyctiphanes norvegica]